MTFGQPFYDFVAAIAVFFQLAFFGLCVRIPRFHCGNGQSHVILKYCVVAMTFEWATIPQFHCGHCQFVLLCLGQASCNLS